MATIHIPEAEAARDIKAAIAAHREPNSALFSNS
jgi:hypothetical protein